MKNIKSQTIAFLCALTALLCSALAFGQTPQDSGALTVRRSEPATVEIWNRPIVILRAAIGNREPKDRAQDTRERIEAIPYSLLAEGVTVGRAKIGSLEGMVIYAGDNMMFGLVPEDIDPESSQTLEQAADNAASQLREVLQARIEQRRVPVLLRGILLTLLATIVLGIALWVISRIVRRQVRRIQKQPKLGFKIRNINLSPFLTSIERGLINLTGFGVSVIAAYFWLTFVLLRFPYSRPWGRRVGAYLTNLLAQFGHGAIAALPGLFAVIVIFVITRVVVKAVDGVLHSAEDGRLETSWLEPETARATRRLSKALIWIFAVTVAYPYIPGSGTDAFKGVSVFVGLMISLGSAGLVNQIMHGLVIVYSRALKAGDYVKTGEIRGVVSEVGLLSTKITTRRREEITIPNSLLTSDTVTNYSRLAGKDGAVVGTPVKVGYDAPWRQVEAILKLAAARTPDIRQQPPPRVIQRTLSDFFVEYELVFNIDQPDRRPFILSKLHAQIQDAFNEFGVQIMSPHYLKQPEERVVVPKSEWFAAPAKDSNT